MANQHFIVRAIATEPQQPDALRLIFKSREHMLGFAEQLKETARLFPPPYNAWDLYLFGEVFEFEKERAKHSCCDKETGHWRDRDDQSRCYCGALLFPESGKITLARKAENFPLPEFIERG